MLLFFYNLLLPFALLISFPFYLRRMLKRGNYARNFGQRFGFYSKPLQARFAEGQWTWIRAVSVGEVGMAVRLLQELKKQDPTLRALISTTTSTGYLLGLRQADLSPAEFRHEIDGLGSDPFRGECQVAFVLPVFIVDQNDHAPLADLPGEIKSGRLDLFLAYCKELLEQNPSAGSYSD